MFLETTGDGPAIVLIHGIPGSGAAWTEVAADLATDHRVLIPDLLGFGRSPRARGIDALGLDAQARALDGALAAAGVERAVVVGHDYGVPTALTLYSWRPDLFEGLVVAAGNVFTDTPIPLPIRAVTWPVVGRLAEAVLFSGPSLAMMLRQGATRRLDRGTYLGDAAQQHAIRTIFAASLRELPERYRAVEALLPDVAVPTTVVWGDSDPFFAPTQGERIARAIPGAELRILDGCGHFIPGERPRELAGAVRELTSALVAHS